MHLCLSCGMPLRYFWSISGVSAEFAPPASSFGTIDPLFSFSHVLHPPNQMFIPQESMTFPAALLIRQSLVAFGNVVRPPPSSPPSLTSFSVFPPRLSHLPRFHRCQAPKVTEILPFFAPLFGFFQDPTLIRFLLFGRVSSGHLRLELRLICLCSFLPKVLFLFSDFLNWLYLAYLILQPLPSLSKWTIALPWF